MLNTTVIIFTIYSLVYLFIYFGTDDLTQGFAILGMCSAIELHPHLLTFYFFVCLLGKCTFSIKYTW